MIGQRWKICSYATHLEELSVLSAKLKFRLRCFDFGSVSTASFLDINEEEVEAMITLQVFKSFGKPFYNTFEF